MRRWLIALAACSSTTPSPRQPMPVVAAPSHVVRHAEPTSPVDVLATLAAPRETSAAIQLGPAQFVLGGPIIEPVADTRLDVDLLERRGNDIRVGVRLAHAAFAVWTTRARMLAIVTREQHVSASAGGDAPSDLAVELKVGARVERLAHHEQWTKIRYVDRVQIEGWIPDGALADSGPPHTPLSTYINRSLLVTPGAALRDATRFDGRTLATFRYSLVADEVATLPDGWVDVRYEDGDVRVHGYLGKFLAPSPYRSTREPDPPAPFTPTTTVPAHTCLYAAGEPVGFMTDAAPAVLAPSIRVGSFDLTLDTPWGPITFDVRGPTETTLETCGS